MQSLQDGVQAIEQLKSSNSVQFIDEVSSLLAEVFRSGNHLIIAGNGGSLCDAAHFAEELTGYFRGERPALPAIVLSEAGHITCVGNDAGFDEIFSRGIQAHGRPGDVFVGLTTSGNSPNIIRAFQVAKAIGLHTVAFLGKSGGALKGVADYELLIEGFATSDRIQEAHMTAIHILIECLEAKLFSEMENIPEMLNKMINKNKQIHE